MTCKNKDLVVMSMSIISASARGIKRGDRGTMTNARVGAELVGICTLDLG